MVKTSAPSYQLTREFSWWKVESHGKPSCKDSSQHLAPKKSHDVFANKNEKIKTSMFEIHQVTFKTE